LSRFLARARLEGDWAPNWPRARWEYLVYAIQGGNRDALAPVGLWEAGGDVAAAVVAEEIPGEAFLLAPPEQAALKNEMLRHAEGALSASEGPAKRLTVWVDAGDDALAALARAAGYVRAPHGAQVTSRLDIAGASLEVALPPGFRLTDRAARNDLHAINRVLWRGFNHPGPPPEEHVAGRADVERAPLYRADLVVMAEAADGQIVSYGGMWYEAETQLVYVEPVATDPDYRRRGLGRAVVLEGIRRAAQLGARRAIVGSDLSFYRAMGFAPLCAHDPWHKAWSHTLQKETP
jgi:predicted N-acetyltransferase YhbS